MTSKKGKKSEDNSSYKWCDTAGHTHYFIFGNSNVVNTKLTWIVLLISALVIAVIGAVVLICIPTKTHESVPQMTMVNSAQPNYVPTQTFKIKEEKPLVLCAGKDNSFWVADRKGVCCYDNKGKQLQNLPFKAGTADSKEEKNTLPTAICFYFTGDENVPSLLYIAFGDTIAVLDPQQKDSGTNLIKLKGNALISSMKAWDQWLFLADCNNKVILRYDLKDLKNVLKIGLPEDNSDFPGFTFSAEPYFSMAVDNIPSHLLVTNPTRYRIEAFNIEDGIWQKEHSWDKQPGHSNAFSGNMNPVYLDTFSNGNVLTSEKGKIARLRLFDRNGSFIMELPRPENSSEIEKTDEKEVFYPVILNTEVIVIYNSVNNNITIYEKNVATD